MRGTNITNSKTWITAEYVTQILMWDLFDCLPDHMREKFIEEIKAIKENQSE